MCECVLVHTDWCLGLGSQHLLTVFLPWAGEEEWFHNPIKDQKAGHQETQDFKISRGSFCPQTYPCMCANSPWDSGEPKILAQTLRAQLWIISQKERTQTPSSSLLLSPACTWELSREF